MVMFSRSTKPCPRHQPRVEALEERLALNVGTAASAIALQYPAAVEETNLGTVTPAVATNLGTVTPAVAVDNGSGVPRQGFQIFPPNSKAYGKTLTEWSTTIWRWLISGAKPGESLVQTKEGQVQLMSIPAGTETGKKDPTYKLPILKGQLEITVSPETAFVLPVFGFIGERYQGYPKVPDDQPIPNRDFLAGVHPTLTIDGKTVLSDANKAAYYLPKTDFHPIVHYETPHDNGAVGAVFFQGVAIVIPPLSTGVHKIRLYEPAPIFGVTFDNTWIVTVRPE